MAKSAKVKCVIKKVFGHLKEDEKDYRKGIREDQQLKKVLKKGACRGK